MVDALGWIATAFVVGSYFCTSPTTLRVVQMLGAVIWTAYGIFIDSLPVIAANLLVIAAAAWTAARVFKAARQRLAPVPSNDASRTP
jgi:hypothetical protein